MDPDNADIEGKISATERELELDRYNIFPLYPTGMQLKLTSFRHALAY